MRPQFDASHILEPDRRTVRHRAHNQFLEIFDVSQAAFGDDRDRQLRSLRRRLPPDGSGRIVAILFADDPGDIARRQLQLRHQQRIQDDPHAVILLPEHERVADAPDPFQIVDQPERSVVRQEHRVMPRISRLQRDDHHKIRRQLFDGNALTDDVRGKLRFGEFFAVLRLHLSDIRIGADFEGELDRDMAVIAAGRFVVEQIVDAGKRHLDRTRHGFCRDFRTCAGIVGIDLDDRRRDLRELRDRQKLHS